MNPNPASASATSASTESVRAKFPTPETDAVAERLTPVVESMTLENARSVLVRIVTELVVHSSKMERDRDQLRIDLAALTHERDSLAASNATFQRLCREAQDAAQEACIRAESAANMVAGIEAENDGLRKQRDEYAAIASKEATDGMLDVHAICEQRDAAVQQREELQLSIQDLSHPNCRMLLQERDRALAALRLCRDALKQGVNVGFQEHYGAIAAADAVLGAKEEA